MVGDEEEGRKDYGGLAGPWFYSEWHGKHLEDFTNGVKESEYFEKQNQQQLATLVFRQTSKVF